MKERVVVLLSQIGGSGGVPRYNRLLCNALRDYERQRQIHVEVVALNDSPGSWTSGLTVTGCGGRRVRFVLEAVLSMVRPYSVVIVGQVDLGPVALAPHLLHRRSRMLALVHGTEVWTRRRWFKRLALRAADRIWSVSQYTKNAAVAAQGIAADRVWIVPNVLDPTFADAGPKAVFRPQGKKLLSVSRLDPTETGKGINMAIGALREVRVTVPDVRYTIVGGGGDQPRLERLSQSLGVADLVTFAGEVSNERLQEYFRDADVFVLPSRQEGFGIVFLEAMAYGLPVIAGAHGGSPEVVQDGVTGLLVEHDDEAGLARAICTLLEDGNLRKAMGRAGAERVRSRFTYERLRSSVFETLDEWIPRARVSGVGSVSDPYLY